MFGRLCAAVIGRWFRLGMLPCVGLLLAHRVWNFSTLLRDRAPASSTEDVEGIACDTARGLREPRAVLQRSLEVYGKTARRPTTGRRPNLSLPSIHRPTGRCSCRRPANPARWSRLP